MKIYKDFIKNFIKFNTLNHKHFIPFSSIHYPKSKNIHLIYFNFFRKRNRNPRNSKYEQSENILQQKNLRYYKRK